MRAHPRTHRQDAPDARQPVGGALASAPPPAAVPAASPVRTPAACAAPRFQPLYRQIKTAILQGIESGEWSAGEMIPSEMDLARRFSVSQGTVRKAVEALAAENMLARRQGKGTYVSSHREARAQFRFLRLRPDEGPATQPSSRILDCRRSRAPADVARALSIRTGESVLFIRRLLAFEETPVVLDDIWLAGEEFRQLTAERLANHSGQLYAVIESELGTKMIRASEKLRAVCASEGQADALGVEHGSPLLLVERVTSTFNGLPVELRRGLCRTDRHHYVNEL
ncbi:MAG: GntR family transcriptional regulator [Lautropia sp.]|nr:GntR family transcriptional regulator [Lautropia sp.]